MSFVIDSPHSPTVPVSITPPVPAPRRVVNWLTRRGTAHMIMLALSLIALLPLVSLVMTAFTVDGTFSFAHFTYVFETIPMASMLANTLLMATVMTVAQLVIALLASYAFAVFEFKGKKLLYILFIASWLVPFQVTMIPNYVLVSQLGLLNTVAGVVLPNLCSAFAVIMLRQHIRAIPRELLDAASMDGRGSFSALWLVVVPNLGPALASLAVVSFISAWNEYQWPIIVMQQEMGVVQVGIRAFLGAEGNNWGAIMAASGLACLPVIALYLVLQRQVVAGFVRSGLK